MSRDAFGEFIHELDRSSNLSDDPFDVDVTDPLDDEDLVLISPPKKTPKKPRKKS